MNKLQFKHGNREWITHYHSLLSVSYFFSLLFSLSFFNPYIHATSPHDFSRVVFNLDNLRWNNGLILASCNDTVRYHSAILEHALWTRVAVAGATVGAAMMEVTAAAFC